MRFLVYCSLNRDNIETSLGTADYSYYFVMQRFLPLLQEFGEVVTLQEPPGDELVASHQREDQCIYLAFTPPDKAAGSHLCPVVPVFAWEYSTIPYEVFKYPTDNWVEDLRATGRAITHSGFAVEVVREQLGEDYNITSIPAPLWDACAQLRAQRAQVPPQGLAGLDLHCKIIDSHNYDISNTAVRPGSGAAGERARLLAQSWDSQPLHFSFARGERHPSLVGFNDVEPWGVWSRSGHPWLMLDQSIEGEVEVEITARGYAHNLGQPLSIELGNCTAYLILAGSLTTHTLRMSVDKPTNFLAFGGVEKRAVGMDDPRDIGFGLADIRVRRSDPQREQLSELKLDFSADDLELEGFHEQELPGRWTAASRCTVNLAESVSGDLNIRIETFNLLNNHKREVELWIGGVSHKIVLHSKCNSYEVKLSGVGPTDCIRLDNLGIGPSGSDADPRALGLGIARISVRPRSGAQRAIRSGKTTKHPAPTPEVRGPQPDGVLYTAILNPNDGRKNWEDIITAFVYALRDRPGATLLVKITNENLNMFFEEIFTFFTRLHPFQCRIVFIHGYLPDEDYQQLIVNSHYIVNASRGEGQCLPLMEFMSSGVPAIAPRNTAMLDYIDAGNAFLVESSPELAYWPHDPRQVYRTFWHRINWQTLYQAFVDSEEVCRKSPGRYRQMGAAAIASLQQFCSMDVARESLREFLSGLQDGGEA